MANNYNEEYYKVAFVTTHSGNIPNMLRYTGSLIVMSDLTMKDPLTNKNRLSLWLRGECIASGWGFSSTYLMTNGTWWANSYNRIFGPNGAQEFDPESDYNKGNGYDQKTYDSNGRPISISNKIDFTYTYLKDSNKVLQDNIDNVSEDLNNKNNQINIRIDNVVQNHNHDIANINRYLVSYKDSCYNYTDYRIENLIGGAPEILDTLGEISYWLENAQKLGITTIKEVMNIKSSYVTRDKRDDNGYTYITSKTYKTVPNGTGEGYVYEWDKDTKKWNKTDKTYTYTTYGVVEDGIIALKPEHVTTPFSNHNLETILKRIITPYPYKYPSLIPLTIEGKDANIWMNEAAPIGSTLSNIQAIYDVANNDASTSISATVNNKSGNISNNRVSIPINITINNVGNNIIANTYSVAHGAAMVKEYPQLVGLTPSVYDEDHKYNAGTSSSTFTKPISKIGKYEFYAGYDSDVTDMNKFDIEFGTTIVGNKFFAEGNLLNGNAISGIINPNKTSTVTWLLIHANISLDKVKLYIVDENTKLEQCIYENNSSNYISDIVKIETGRVTGTKFGFTFNKFKLTSKRYPFSNVFRFKIVWN